METDIQLLTDVINYNHDRYIAFKNNLIFEENKDFERILSARYMKVSRVKKHLIYLLCRFRYIWFCTFTFDDYYINKCDRTKRDLIKNVINSRDFKYILNVDYGKKTEREHYHCIIATNDSLDLNNYLQDNYSCFCSALLCNTTIDDVKRLTKYINKLTNHCIKATTKKQRIYYNFKAYDNFRKLSSHEKWVMYKRDCVSLLDKANTSGKINV